MPDVTQIKVKEIIYDIKDATARSRSIPSGGTTGQFLKKNSNTSYDASWANVTIPEYNEATSTSSGLMSANDKIKLDGFSTASNYYTKSEIDSNCTPTSILPNDTDMVKTKYRVTKKGTTGSSSTVWYFPLVKLPKTSDGNYASLIVSGRIGGWLDTNLSYYQALIWNRNGTGIASIDISGGATSESSYFNVVDIVIYKDNTTLEETIYLKCQSYYVFDLDLELLQVGASIIYDGSYSAEAPSGTLTAQASTSNKRLALCNSKLLINGTEVKDTTYTASTTSIGSASAGTAIKADDITSWSTGTLPTLGTAISADDITAWSTGTLPTLGTAIKAHNISSWSTGTLPTLGTAIPADDITAWSTGTLPTLGTAISADDITAWSTGTLPSATVQNENLILSFGSLPSLSYTTRSIPNVTGVGTLPSLSYDSKSIPNITGIGTLPSLSYSEKTIPNITAVGTLPNLSYDSKSIPNVTSVGTLPSLSYTEKTIPNISVTNKTVVTEILDS